jgi:hypothetical protein
MFFFMSGMAIATKAAIGSLAYAIVLAFGNVELEYTAIVATGDMIPGLLGVIASVFLIVLGMFGFFLMFGRRLWKIYYDDSASRKWFMVYITLSFLLGLVITMLVV